MTDIEERAKKASEGYSDEGYEAGLYMGYKVGATEQKVIDDRYYSEVLEVTLLEKETIYGKILEGQRKALIDKAWKIIRRNANIDELEFDDFRRAMEEEQI